MSPLCHHHRWLYESLERTLGTWAALHGCDETPAQADPTVYDPVTNMSCFARTGCAAGKHVQHCMYDGNHGNWPTYPVADNYIWAFFNNLSANVARSSWHPTTPRYAHKKFRTRF